MTNIAGWIVFAIALFVYILSAERTGSLWDCGEFVTGSYKLQVVHPPGAPLFLLIGRMFTLVATTFSSDPANIAFAVNILSGICTAFCAMLVCWITIILGKLAMFGREEEPEGSDILALCGGGVVAGLTTAFCSSIWFSAVEGEVYAMSTFFTALTFWSIIKWYNLPDTASNDRWVVFAIYAAGLSMGVHLLSLLTFPALALFYYFKKYENTNFLGMLMAMGVGIALIVGIQLLVILGIPKLWGALEVMMVNSFGAGFQSGIYPLVVIVSGVLIGGIYAARKSGNSMLHNLMIAMTLVVISFSTIGVVVIRANANTPINMNNPSDPIRLIPYLNREQYGERPLLKGPHFDAKPVDTKVEKRLGQLGDRYEYVDHKVSYVFDPKDEIFFPRIGHYEQGRPAQHRKFMGGKKGKPTQADNMRFLFKYQMTHMYWRYFMWNFVGRQNGDQGFNPDDPKNGHWLSGIPFIDSARLYNQSELPEAMLKHKARNKYYFLPLLFGILGLLFHFKRRPKEAFGLLTLFVITGIGIIIYSNQPPSEPRERDYVLAGSFFAFSIWIGMGAIALFSLLKTRMKLAPSIATPAAVGLALMVPAIMGFQNFDDHSRASHTGARDYASNFLNSCEKDAIIFTYGDNDTYPLWYAQEVEGIRTDVRVVNLSLIAVDWYIDQIRRKINDSPAIKMTVPSKQYRGFKRNQIPYFSPNGKSVGEMNLQSALKFMASDKPLSAGGGRTLDTYLPTKDLYIPVDRNQVTANGTVSRGDSSIVDKISFKITKNQLLKSDLAILDIIGSNLWERPIYFAVTCRQESLMGLQDYTQLEGLSLRIVPVKSSPERQYGIMGNGRVNEDAVYDNIMNKYRWGNFDKEELFVDRSYGPSIQSHRVAILRTAQSMVKKGDKKRAVDLIQKYFEAFPNMNFRYDYNAFYMISLLAEAGAVEEAKPHLEILAKETVDHLQFYYSLDNDDLKAFGQDFAITDRTKDDILDIAKKMKDNELLAKFQDMFAEYNLDRLNN